MQMRKLMFDSECRALNDSKEMRMVGYALKFDKVTSLDPFNKFKECIARNALKDTIMDDVTFLLNHDSSKLIARTVNGSLKLTIDDIGLKFESTLIDTSLNRDVYSMAENGLLTKCSFSFVIDWEDESSRSYQRLDDGSILRTINKIYRLYDVSIVTNPAYEDTEVYARDKQSVEGFEQFKNALKEKDLRERINKLVWI